MDAAFLKKQKQSKQINDYKKKKKRRFSIDFSNPFLNVFRKNGLAKFHFLKFYNKPSKCSSSKSFLNLGLCKFQKFVKKFVNIQSMIVDRRKDKN